MRHVIWMKRLEIVSVLLQRGEDVLLSDLDAIWLQNPYADISSHLQAGSSIISSRATYPEEISRVWGRSLCMGFLYLKSDNFTNYLLPLVLADMQSTYAMFNLYEKFLRTGNLVYLDTKKNTTMVFDRAVFTSMSKKAPDDQHSFNIVLYKLNITWDRQMRKHVNASQSYSGRIMGMNGSVNYVTMLPEQTFLRSCVDIDHLPASMRYFKLYPTVELRERIYHKVSAATVAHCLISTTEAKKKESYLVFYSLYALPYNAKDVSVFLFSDASSGATLRLPNDASSTVASSSSHFDLPPASLNSYIVNATELNEYLEKRRKRAKKIRDLLRNSSSSSWSHASHRQSIRSSSRRQIVSYRGRDKTTAVPMPPATVLVTVRPMSPQEGHGSKSNLRGSNQRHLDDSGSY
ncbi:hypothetical protein EON65_54965 [archaeon]|nr:MAG: hypothetical protein EON65_54965 [archaeon]